MMNILVLGSGVIGVTTAYYLARAGHKVTVIDRQSAPAMEASFANAGQISPGYSTPWAAPGLFIKALKWLMQKHSPLHIIPDGSLFQLQWLYQLLRNCTADRYAINKSCMLQLAEYSHDCLKKLRQETHIHYEDQQRGTLQIFRTAKQLEHAKEDIFVLDNFNIKHKLLTSHQELINIEPGLAHSRHQYIGGLWLPNDETGNCKLFTTQLAKMAEALGVEFRYNLLIDKIVVQEKKVTGIACGQEILQADNYIASLGPYTTLLMRDIIPLLVYPIKGYSITLPIVDEKSSPISTVLDETYKIAITRLGNHIRVGGMAEVVGYNTKLNLKRRDTLAMVVNDIFPKGGYLQQATFWTGLRAMTPSNVPIVGATPLRNLYVNTGHGTLGWTMACGCAQLLTDLISNYPPALNMQSYAINRH